MDLVTSTSAPFLYQRQGHFKGGKAIVTGLHQTTWAGSTCNGSSHVATNLSAQAPTSAVEEASDAFLGQFPIRFEHQRNGLAKVCLRFRERGALCVCAGQFGDVGDKPFGDFFEYGGQFDIHGGLRSSMPLRRTTGSPYHHINQLIGNHDHLHNLLAAGERLHFFMR